MAEEKAIKCLHKMSAKSCIYEWMGVVGKYTGCFPLPGVYEKREWSKFTKAFVNYVIPLLNFLFFLFLFIVFCSQIYSFGKSADLSDLLLAVVDGCIYAHFVLSTVLNHFYLRRNLVSYLKMHSSVDQLLQNNKRKMKRFVRIVFVLSMVSGTIHRGLISSAPKMKKFSQLYYANPTEMLIRSCSNSLIGFLVSLAMGTHPMLMYIVFQRVLKSSFDKLLEKIKKNKNKKLNREMQVKKIRKYMKLYGDLSKISVRLDSMVSPLMLIRFIQHYMGEIHAITLIMHYSSSKFILPSWAAMVLGFFVLIVVSNFAYLTQTSRNEILPAIYSAFNSNEKDVKKEVQNFSVQSMYFNTPFSVSGFVQLDRNLIFAICQSLISQVVAFHKIRKENVSTTL